MTSTLFFIPFDFHFHVILFYLASFFFLLGLQYGSEEVERILDLTFQYLEDGVEEGIIKSKLNNDNSDEQKEEIDIEGRISLPCPILFCSVPFCTE